MSQQHKKIRLSRTHVIIVGRPINRNKRQHCQRYNHFASVCKLQGKNTVDTIEESYQEETLMTLYTTADQSNTVTNVPYPSKLHADLKMEGHRVHFQLDTGTSCNVTSRQTYPPPCPYNLRHKPSSYLMPLP